MDVFSYNKSLKILKRVKDISDQIGSGGTLQRSKGIEVLEANPTGDDLWEGRIWIVLPNTTPVNTAPSVPTNLASSAITTSGFTLSWSASTDTQGNPITYKVYKNSTIYQSDVTGTSLAITGQSTGSNAMWTVSASDGTLDSAQSSGLSVTILTVNTAPSYPTISFVSKTDTTITIQLATAGTDTEDGTITSYEVYKNSTLHATITLAQGANYTLTDLTPSTSYDIRLKSKDSSGVTSATSNGVIQTTNAPVTNTAPTVPTGLSSSNIANTSFTLTWNASTDAQSNPITYKVYKDGTLYQSGISTTNLGVTGQTAGSTAMWTVSAGDGNLDSAQSSGLSVTTTNVVLATFTDNFDGANGTAPDSTYWSTAAYLGGSVQLNGSGSVVASSSATSDGAMLIRKDFPIKVNKVAKMKFTPITIGANLAVTVLHVRQHTTIPSYASLGESKFYVHAWGNSAGTSYYYSIYYNHNNGGVAQGKYWDGTTWNVTPSTLSTNMIPYNTESIIILEQTETQFRFIGKNANETVTHFTTSWVNFTDVYNLDSRPIYHLNGDFTNGANFGTIHFNTYSEA